MSKSCRFAKVSRQNVYSRTKTDAAFNARFVEAKEEGTEVVEEALRDAAVAGVKSKTVTRRTFKDGSIETTEQVDVKPSVTAMIFLLKSLRPDVYRERNPLENINELDLAELADEELETFTELARKAQRRA